MTIKLYVKLQTPTIELKVQAKDAAGEKDTLIVGFKRYNVSDAQKKFKELQTILADASEAEESGEATAALDNFVKNEVVYLKSISLETVDEQGKVKPLSVADTRTVKPVETLWGSPEEALEVLTSIYMDSAPYRVSFLNAATKALLNNDYTSGEIKN